ncbi:alpha/beta hydrolase [Kibdelosporangium philippinense]|uniref:Alpha/beta hydrolase n=1 Tax=Kibdelosporangium philippinense TaxID=211113 RepID=A0ABS8ZDE2_9PSEU|nr:alpha/beta hydrolase [Kibdelosporangium philippinense]MCE7005552.1 alpha/beta hydrolase [Kibdelosporangium philippinense]
MVSWQAYGSGNPVTIVVPGLGATPGEARIPASGLPGTRVVVTLPSHGDEPDAPEGYWRYETIAADVLKIADEVKAQKAIGVSLGAAVLTRIAAENPDRFDRIALLLPAVLDQPRAAEVQAVLRKQTSEDEIAKTLPTGYALGDYVQARAKAMRRLTTAIDELAPQFPIVDREALRHVTAPTLVISAVGDPLHPAEIAEQVAAAFAKGQLEVFDSTAPLITHRAQLRALLQVAWRA